MTVHPIAPPVVELCSVSKRFGTMPALREVSLCANPGEVVAILGPNGAGKTTAISIMLGIRKPTSGGARMFGMNPRDLRARSRCGVMLQDTGLPWTLTVIELIELFRTYYPDPLPTPEIMEIAGITEIAHTRAGDLSGGQRQRLSFALAICGDPSLLFLDEPTVGLDVESRRAFWREMKRYASNGTSIVMTTHYMEEAEALADRVIVIHDGQVVADAPAHELTSRASGKRVRLALLPGSAATVFDDLPVTGLEITGDIATYMTDEPERVLHELWLREVEYQVLDVRGAALEDAVTALTHEAEEDRHVRIA